jgi:heterodisulfide reductase subunit D
VLQRAGVTFTTLGGEEWCCGYPLISAGRDVEPLIEHNIRAVEALGARWLITSCPSCYHTWKLKYPPASFQVVHATELLAALIDEGRIVPAHPPALRRAGDTAGPLRVTYHDPCDLGRKSGVYDAPRHVITSLPGVELVEMSTHHALATCCGGGGNLESIDPELSAQIAGRRLAQAQRVKAEVIVTACQQCQRTLGMAARRQRLRMPVMDVAELLLSTLEEPA